MSSQGTYEFKTDNDRDVTSIFLETLSEAWSKRDVAPDPNWFQGKSDYMSTLGQNLNEPKSLWQRIKNYWLNVIPGAVGGALLGSIIPGVGNVLGALVGGFVGAVASVITQPITALVNFGGSSLGQLQALVQDAAVTGTVATAGFIAAKNGLGSALGII